MSIFIVARAVGPAAVTAAADIGRKGVDDENGCKRRTPAHRVSGRALLFSRDRTCARAGRCCILASRRVLWARGPVSLFRVRVG